MDKILTVSYVKSIIDNEGPQRDRCEQIKAMRYSREFDYGSVLEIRVLIHLYCV